MALPSGPTRPTLNTAGMVADTQLMSAPASGGRRARDTTPVAEPSEVRPTTPPETLDHLKLYLVLAVLIVPPVAAVVLLLGRLGLLADIAPSTIVLLLLGANLLGTTTLTLFSSPSRAHLNIRSGVGALICTVCIYASGWGPALLSAFLVYQTVNAVTAGPAAYRTAMWWLPAMALCGQLALEWHLAPTLISAPEVHGLAVLSLAGTILTAGFVYRSSTLALEAAEGSVMSERRFRMMVQNTSDIVALVDRDLVVHYISPAAWRVLGLDPGSLEGHPLTARIHPGDLGSARSLVLGVESAPDRTFTQQIRIMDATGGWRWAETTASILPPGPGPESVILSMRDVTDHKAVEAELSDLAFFDPLTGLPNRRWFNDRFAQAAARARRYGSTAAVLFVDLDGFKQINDTHGHHVGDAALREVAARLLGCLRREDCLARFGGDEFLVLVEDLGYPGQTLAIAQRIVEAGATPYILNGLRLEVTASIGIASSSTATTPEDAVRQADLAMYVAKSKGKRCFHVYEPVTSSTTRSAGDGDAP